MTPKEFKKARNDLGLTQAEMAEKLGYSRQPTIAEKEAGKASITRQDEIILHYLKIFSDNA